MNQQQQLPRLSREAYRGRAYVSWTHTVEHRARGWLDAGFHFAFREVLLHTQSRFHLSCPIYVCMPDHFHLLWIGLSLESDQLKASRFLRREINKRLFPARLQRQPYDHVFREWERVGQRLTGTIRYVRNNPVHAELVTEFMDWPYMGALIPGYPNLSFRKDEFWEIFWKCHCAAQKRCESEPDGSPLERDPP